MNKLYENLKFTRLLWHKYTICKKWKKKTKKATSKKCIIGCCRPLVWSGRILYRPYFSSRLSRAAELYKNKTKFKKKKKIISAIHAVFKQRLIFNAPLVLFLNRLLWELLEELCWFLVHLMLSFCKIERYITHLVWLLCCNWQFVPGMTAMLRNQYWT